MPTEIKKTSTRARLFKYHPERFFILRSFPEWSEAVRYHSQQLKIDQRFALIPVGELIADSYSEARNGLDGIESTSFSSERIARALQDERGGGCSSVEMAVAGWRRNGEQIFDLSAISAMFLDADSTDVPIAQLKLPFDSFYLYWGAHLRLASPFSDRYIDGCYIGRDILDSEKNFELTFTSSHPVNDPWDSRSLLANLVVDVEGAMGFHTNFSNNGTIGGIAEGMASGGLYGPETVERWSAALLPALQMAANCLCYLASDKAEVREEYPPEAPAKLLRQSNSLRSTEKRRATSKLAALGFRVVYLCGERLAEALGLVKGDATMPPHWRRGHWRHQRHGFGRSEIKVIWIDGMIVNQENGAPDLGHIYVG